MLYKYRMLISQVKSWDFPCNLSLTSHISCMKLIEHFPFLYHRTDTHSTSTRVIQELCYGLYVWYDVMAM